MGAANSTQGEEPSQAAAGGSAPRAPPTTETASNRAVERAEPSQACESTGGVFVGPTGHFQAGSRGEFARASPDKLAQRTFVTVRRKRAAGGATATPAAGAVAALTASAPAAAASADSPFSAAGNMGEQTDRRPQQDVDEDVDGKLYDAAFNGHLDDVKALLAAGADHSWLHESGANALMVAAQNHHTACVESLLAGGADVNAAMRNGSTALMLAIGYIGVSWDDKCPPALLTALLAGGADPNVETTASSSSFSQRSSPLREAILRMDEASVDALLAGGADPNHSTAPLVSASWCGWEYGIEALLRSGADVNQRDEQGQTALWRAASGGEASCARLLMKRGADPSIADNDGLTPADSARLGIPGQTRQPERLAEMLARLAKVCSVCGKAGILQRCGRCEQVRYCSAACQKQAWPAHKKVCGARGSPSPPPRPPPSRPPVAPAPPAAMRSVCEDKPLWPGGGQ